MKNRSTKTTRVFQLKLLDYGIHYYIERVAALEKAVARRPRTLQIELIGVGEMPADMALLIRSILLNRSARTRLVTQARSSLQAGAVLIWLLGDSRVIRADAQVHFRKANLPDDEAADEWEEGKGEEPNFRDSYSQIEPEEGDYCRVLELINEYLPVREFAGRLIGPPVLKQFGLVESDPLDRFLASAMSGKPAELTTGPPKKRVRTKTFK